MYGTDHHVKKNIEPFFFISIKIVVAKKKNNVIIIHGGEVMNNHKSITIGVEIGCNTLFMIG